MFAAKYQLKRVTVANLNLCCTVVIIVSVSDLILDNISGYGFFSMTEDVD